MFWSKRKKGNRRYEREHVLDVKLRSSQVRAARVRLAGIAAGVSVGTVVGFLALWQVGGWALNCLVYNNPSFAIENIEVQTDGVLAPDQLRRWSGVRPGQNLLALDLGTVKRYLEMQPVIQTVSIERILPRTLRIRATERQPVAQVNVAVPHAGGQVSVMVYQIDDDGFVMRPLQPWERDTSAGRGETDLPLLAGINANDLQPGRRLDSPQVQAALQLLDEFGRSDMAAFIDLKQVDVSSPGVLVAVTTQGSQITFGLDNFSRQLARWREIRDMGARMSKAIATLDLAVTNNIPARFVDASAAPPTSRNLKPPRSRKRNV